MGKAKPEDCGSHKARLWLMGFFLTFFIALPASATGDTSRVLTQDAFLSIVRAYHPVAKSAALQVMRARAGILQARGAFDPAVSAGLNSKTLDGKNYYQYFSSELSIPTWYGLELVGGIEDVRGERVSSEATIGRLSYAGVKLNLTGIGLDARRAALQQARSVAQQSEAERLLAVNNLLYEALNAYFTWQREWQNLGIIADALNNARERYRFVRLEYEGGARPAMDTVEALTQLQAIELQQSGVAVAYRNAVLELSNYLWLENGEPLPPDAPLLPADALPARSIPQLQSLLGSADRHPKLRALGSKLSILDVERRLKGTYLLPKLSVKATALSKGYQVPYEGGIPYLDNNNKLLLELRMPLLLREARGAYRAAGLKIEEANLELDAATLTIENKIRSAYNELLALNTQVGIAQSALVNYQRLYNGERLKFEAGESTLFLLNSRQNKVIEGAQKLVELQAKRQKAEAGLYYAAGQLQ